jgi:beta-galactosidase
MSDEHGPDSDSLSPTLSFRPGQQANGCTVPVAWQSGLPVPLFDPQDRPRLDVGKIWRKERVQLDTSLTLATRNEQGLAGLEATAAGRYLPDYDDSEWATKELPAVENQMPELPGDSKGPEPYEGGVWYRRNFSVPADWQGKRVTLNFLAVNYVIDVWVNGRWAGYHEGGYTPFALDVSSVLQYGQENVIALRVDNPPWMSCPGTVPAVKPDWWNYTGVIQDLYLEAAPRLWIVRADVHIPDTSGQIQVSVVIHNAGEKRQSGDLNLCIRETDPAAPGWLTDPRASAIAGKPAGSPFATPIQVEPGEALVVQVDMQILNPALWRPESPALYVLEAHLRSGQEVDATAYQFGVRTVDTQGHNILLNGSPIFLAGIARHEEWPDSGRTATWEKIRADLQQIRELGANFLRTAHYPNHIYTYILSDRIGLATAVEIPLWQYTAVEYTAQESRRIADQMWREMILSGSNRPSILLWSTNNESREVPSRTAFIQRVVADYRTNYPDGRLVTQSAAADRGGPADPSQAEVDVAGWTMYFGIFHGSTYYEGTANFLREAHAAYPDRPLLNTEYGIWSRGDGSSEERQIEVFQETIRALTDVTARDRDGAFNPDGYLAGIVWWTAFDWYTSHTKLQTMGLYHMDRKQAKPVAHLLQEVYLPWAPHQSE